MNRELVTYQTYESPKKTGGVIVGVTLLIVGVAIIILYLVRKSREADEEALRQLLNRDKPIPVSQAKATTVEGLLDELFAFGTKPSQGVIEKTGCTISVACNYDPLANIPDNASCDFTSCYDDDEEILATTRLPSAKGGGF